MSDDLKTALELHAEADEANATRLDARLENLENKIEGNHKELLIAVTELKTAKQSSGAMSGIITSGVLVSLFEAVRQIFTH